jgi:hypothetical protein
MNRPVISGEEREQKANGSERDSSLPLRRSTLMRGRGCGSLQEHLMKSEDRNAGATTTDRVSVKLLEAA